MERCLGCMETCNSAICPGCGYIKGTPPKEIYHLKPGTILSAKYTVGKVLGYGGFGVTYIGWDNKLERKVAIKEFLPEELATRLPGDTHVTVYEGAAAAHFKVGMERFTREAWRLVSFNGVPGIVGILDTFSENNTAYIVMEFLEGKTARELLREKGVLTYEEADVIIKAALRALGEVHKTGVIHRDISPENIFITNSGEVKVIDFGSARYATPLHSKSLSVILKKGYAPEEQYRSRGNQGTWSDVYAVAATYYKLLTGVTIPEAMERVVHDKLKPPSAYGAVLPKTVENAIMNALSVNAEQRTRTADDFLRDLESRVVQRTVKKQEKTETGRVPLWLKIATPILAAVVAAFLLFFITNSNNKMTFGSFFTREAYVPNLINMSDTDAEKSLKKFRLSMVITGQQNSEIVPKGMVLGQNPAAGTLLEKGGTVGILMSAGPEEIVEKDKMPYVLYLTEVEAIENLAALGIAINLTYEESDTVNKGLVISQSVAEGTDVDANTTVTLTVSLGAPEKEQPKKNNTSNNHTNKNTQPVPTVVPTVTPTPQEIIKEAKMQGMQPKPEDNKQDGLKQGGGNQTATKESAPVMSRSVAKPTAATPAPTPEPTQELTAEWTPEPTPESTPEPASDEENVKAGTGGFSLKAAGE